MADSGSEEGGKSPPYAGTPVCFLACCFSALYRKRRVDTERERERERECFLLSFSVFFLLFVQVRNIKYKNIVMDLSKIFTFLLNSLKLCTNFRLYENFRYIQAFSFFCAPPTYLGEGQLYEKKMMGLVALWLTH